MKYFQRYISAAVITASLLLTSACVDPEILTAPDSVESIAAEMSEAVDELNDELANLEIDPEPAVPQPATASIGDSITLQGYEESERIKVTLLRVEDPARVDTTFWGPSKNKRYVAIELRLKNVGTAAYSDAPSNGANVVSRDGATWDASIGEREPDLGIPKIRPGSWRRGWITFEIRKTTRLALFQFSMNSGFADQTGEWKLL